MPTTNHNKMNTKDIVLIAMFATILAVCSWISIPTTIPFTMQTFGIFLAVGVLGGKRGTLAVLVFLLLGAVGAPVFSGFTGGIGILLGSTGGYIIGFLFSALLMWGMEVLLGKKDWVQIGSMVLGLLVCYLFGTLWFMVVYAKDSGAIGFLTALSWCVLPYILPDVVKIGLAFVLTKTLRRAVRLG